MGMTSYSVGQVFIVVYLLGKGYWGLNPGLLNVHLSMSLRCVLYAVLESRLRPMWLYLEKYIDLIYLAVYKLQRYYTFSILVLFGVACKKRMLLARLDNTEIRKSVEDVTLLLGGQPYLISQCLVSISLLICTVSVHRHFSVLPGQFTSL